MNIDKLRATISELERELRGMNSLDTESRRMLEQAMQDIRDALQAKEQPAANPQPLVERLQEAVERFESTHPSLTAVLGRLIDGLAQMGI